MPEFAHLSTILGPDKERLSKRHGATSLANFREMGVLPEALMNYMALLGWAPTGGDREIFSPEELVQEFDLARVTPSPAVFDFEKLYWLNRHYIKEAEPERIAALAEPFYERALEIDELTPDPRRGLRTLRHRWCPRSTSSTSCPSAPRAVLHFDPAAALAAPENAEDSQRATTPMSSMHSPQRLQPSPSRLQPNASRR